MIDKISKYCTNFKAFIYENSNSIYELLLKVLEKQDEIIDEVNLQEQEIIDNYNILNDAKENKIDITNNRKLSPTGNFTGTIQGVNSLTLVTQVDNNEDQIEYLTSQFNDGQTGLVVNGGFFDDAIIVNNYDGGVF